MNRISRLALIGLVSSACACSASETLAGDFNARVDGVAKFLGSRPAEEKGYSFFRNESYVELYRSSLANKDQIARYLLGDAAPNEKKAAIILAQCLPVQDYIKLIDTISDAGNKDRDSVIYALLHPGIEWGKVSYVNAAKGRMREVVQREMARSGNAQRISTYKRLLDGTYLEMQQVEEIKFPPCRAP